MYANLCAPHADDSPMLMSLRSIFIPLDSCCSQCRWLARILSQAVERDDGTLASVPHFAPVARGPGPQSCDNAQDTSSERHDEDRHEYER